MVTKYEYKEYKKIRDEIKVAEKIIKEHYSGGVVQHSILSDLFGWLHDNGGIVFIKKSIVKQKTQEKIIEYYMVKYGMKIELTTVLKKGKTADLRIKLI